jgi:O-antigen ligase
MPLFYFFVFLICFSDPPLISRLFEDSAFKVMGAPCVLYALFYLVAQRKGKLPSYFGTWQARLFVIFYLVAILSYAVKSVSREHFLGSPILMYTSFVVLLFITLTIVDSWRRLRFVLLAAIGSVAFGSVVVIREWVFFHNVLPDFRPGWALGDANYFGTSAVLCLPAGYLFLVNLKTWNLEKLFLAVCLPLGLVGVLLSASRGGFLALAVATVVVAVRSQHPIRNLILITLLIVPLALLLPMSPVHRILHPVAGDQQAVDARLVAWRAGLHMIGHHPLFGIGLGNFKPLMPFYADPGTTVQTMAHDAYVEIAAEMGILQLLIFVGILFFSYRSFAQVRRQAKQSGPISAYVVALGLEAGLIGYAVGAVTLSAQYQKLFWLVLCLSMCVPALMRDTVPVEESAARGLRPSSWRGALSNSSTGSPRWVQPRLQPPVSGRGTPGAGQVRDPRASDGSAFDPLTGLPGKLRR